MATSPCPPVAEPDVRRRTGAGAVALRYNAPRRDGLDHYDITSEADLAEAAMKLDAFESGTLLEHSWDNRRQGPPPGRGRTAAKCLSGWGRGGAPTRWGEKIDRDFETRLLHTVRGIGYVIKVA